MSLLLVMFISVGAADTAVDKMIGEAVAAQKKADEVGGEWRDIQKFIDEAKAALTAGNKEDAMKLAKKAKMHSELGYQQAVEQRGTIQVPSYLQR